MKVELRIKKPAPLSCRAKSRHLRVFAFTSSLLLLTSAWAPAQVADIRLDKNGNVLNSRVNFPPGHDFQLNGVTFTGSGLASYVYRDLNALSTDAINAALVGKTTSNEPILSTRDDTTPTYVASATSWVHALDLTSESVWSSPSGHTPTATLISPRHVVMAHHATLSVGNTLRFRTSSNTVVTRTLSSKSQIGSTDIDIGYLDSDLPSGVTPAKVLSAAQEARLVGAPILFIDQNQSAFVGDVSAVAVTVGSTLTVSATQSADSTRSAFWKAYVSGDSSHPAYAVLDGQAVLLGAGYTSGNTWASVAEYYSAINTAMTSLGGSYQLTQFQGSVLPSFQPLDAGLTSLANLSTTGKLYYLSAADTWSAVTIGANMSFSGGTLSASVPSSVAGISIYDGLTPSNLSGDFATRKLYTPDGATEAIAWDSDVAINFFGGEVIFQPGDVSVFTDGIQVGAIADLTSGQQVGRTVGGQWRFNSVDQNTYFDNTGFYTPARIVLGLAAPTYSTSITPDASAANRFVITATNSTAFTLNAPTNPASGQNATFTIRNTSGGALGTATWNSVFKMSSWTQPANGFSRSITFNYNGTNWIEIARTPADVPN